MPCEYEIKLKQDAKPYSLLQPERSLFSYTKASGVISKVNQATTWCSGMVVVQKKSEGAQIYVDLIFLNKDVL